jgi:hypothetical protein
MSNPKNWTNYIDGRTKAKHYCIEGCGREISYSNWKYGNRRCQNCCHAGNRGSNYKDGTSGVYPIEFNDKLKESIRKRDNYKCQNCDMTEEEHLIVRGQILHVHHIDYDKQNCDEINLITLCCWCNTRANFNHNYWQELYSYMIYLKEI